MPIISPPEAVRRLKKIAKRKSAPSRLKKCVARLKNAQEEHTQAKRSLRDFEKTHANVLKTVSQKRRKVDSTEKEVDKQEISLIMPDRPYKGVELPLIIFPAGDEQDDSFELSGREAKKRHESQTKRNETPTLTHTNKRQQHTDQHDSQGLGLREDSPDLRPPDAATSNKSKP